MIQTSQGLAEYLDNCQGDFRGLDTEADSLHRYHEKLCLLQFTDGENHALIDPLAIEDLSPLTKFLETASIWMHGADYDIVMMRRDLEVVPPVIWDTQIAARLLGVRQFGYANLVQHYLDIELSKASQKADWSQRPLTEKMEQYAINDVRYLKPMAEIMIASLKEKGRYEWFVESCDNAREKVLERPQSKEDPWRISGSGKMNPKGLAYLRALWYWRDTEAAEWDRPSFMVCGNKQLIAWVNQVLKGQTPELPKHFRSQRRKNFFKAITEVQELPDNKLPQRKKAGPKRIKDDGFDDRVNALMEKRDAVAAELDIDSSLIIARAVIESLAANEVEPAEVLMKWQVELLGL
ncbi:ribonuclease D [Rubritalea halochordaticola]|uniref:Ribonuclease D n=1 Tax=Rubritalea halochordaticola TaxID=714537 RepID=A0ABP9V2X6_9BACT